MAGIVTQKRDLSPSKRWSFDYASTTDGPLHAFLDTCIANETTTSFRSGGQWGSEITNPSEILSQNEVKNRFPYDLGNEFQSTRTHLSLSHGNYTIRSDYRNAYYRGPLMLDGYTAFVSGFTAPNGPRYQNTLPSFDLTYGVKAMNQTRPTKSVANLAQMLAELTLDMPRIPYDALKGVHSLGDLRRFIGGEYLGVVFAWQPLVSDVLKICEAIVKSEAIVTQFMRDAGKNVRRSFKFDEESDTQFIRLTPSKLLAWPNLSANPYVDLIKNKSGSAIGGLSGPVLEQQETVYSYWFSCAWTYFMDDGSSAISRLRSGAQLAKQVLGLKLDLELLWELAPWSWLADWFVNIGDIIAVNNALANDSLVLRYGYLTRKTQSKRVISHPGIRFANGHTGEIRNVYHTRQTKRVRATPYGFGLNPAGFTANQWAILAALGMTGGDNKLRWAW